MCRITDAMVLVVLAVIAIRDWKTHCIPVWMLCVLHVLVIGFQICFVKITVWSLCSGILIGGFFLGISKFTGESIGYGDSWLICILGIYLGGMELMKVLLAACMLTLLAAMAQRIVLRQKEKRSLPFVPFLTIAFLGRVFV